ncbi:MAG: hypothetical protein KDD52_03275 [Bdellovibrionales bacterium]|nr:hypothetical protein [Bdellovibrionales bacterium]
MSTQDKKQDQEKIEEGKAKQNQRTTSTHEIQVGKASLRFECITDWMEIHEDEKPDAEMFYVYYRKLDAEKTPNRALTFCFNGGPGASSVFLHLGQCGPWRVDLRNGGEVPALPAQTIENQENWLDFTDLVFVDPIGTGYSRTKEDSEDQKDKKPKDQRRYYATNKDIATLGQFVSHFLSQHKRWSSPLCLAGESYGGYRVARLSKHMQSKNGINVAGALLISPALDFSTLSGSDYNIRHWIDVFPTFVATAIFHGKSQKYKIPIQEFPGIAEEVESFATGPLAKFLILGDEMKSEEKQKVFETFAQMTGLDAKEVYEQYGRISFEYFTRALLKDEQKVLAYHDGALTIKDPFSNRSTRQGPDPLLDAQDRAFVSSIKILFTEKFLIDTSREYRTLHEDIFQNWKADNQTHPNFEVTNATDDLRYGLAINPHMKVMITHGYHDFVTPYFASKRLLWSMRLGQQEKQRVLLKEYEGGHMYYLRDASRSQATQDTREFFAQLTQERS